MKALEADTLLRKPQLRELVLLRNPWKCTMIPYMHRRVF